MDFKQLESFVAVVDEGSFSNAADRLQLSQSMVTIHVRNLEAELGTPLFKRIGKKLIPTEAGKVYINSARQMMAIQKETYKTLADFTDSKTGRISMGITRGIGNTMFCEVFP